MSTKYECDRCGQQEIITLNFCKLTCEDGVQTWDLCNTCAGKLEAWIKNYSKEAAK